MVGLGVFHYVIARVCLTAAGHFIGLYISAIKQTQRHKKLGLERTGHLAGAEVNDNCIHINYKTDYAVPPPLLSATFTVPLMRFNYVLMCELSLRGPAGAGGEELWLFTDVLYPIIFMLSGGRNGKHGLNGAFHMWSNSLLTSGCKYHLNMCFLVALLLSRISWCTKTRRRLRGCFFFLNHWKLNAPLVDQIIYYCCTLWHDVQHVSTIYHFILALLKWVDISTSSV